MLGHELLVFLRIHLLDGYAAFQFFLIFTAGLAESVYIV